MKENLTIGLRKTMTKKAFKELQKRNRSIVGARMNLGTRTMKSNKDLSCEKQTIARMLKSGNWD